MARYIEWNSEELGLTERAEITNVVVAEGEYRILFSNAHLMSDGRLTLPWGKGVQLTEGEYALTDGSYKGKAKVIGHTTETPGTLEFTGTWEDKDDGSGQWDLYVLVENPPAMESTSRYAEPEEV